MLQSAPEYPVIHLQDPSLLQHLAVQTLSSDLVEPLLLQLHAK